MKTVLVTGAAGFIGGYVTETLLARGYAVNALDTRGREVQGATVTLGDVRDATSVGEAVSHADGVIHLAGLLGTAEMVNDPRPAVETNILGAINVFEAAARHDIPVVNIAIGNHWMANTYAITKSTADRFGAMYNAFRGGRITTVRAQDAYGPRQVPAAPFGPSRVRKITPSFACRALTGLPIEVYGTGEQSVDMVYVADVARVLCDALEATEERGPLGVLEAATGIPTTVNATAALIIDQAEQLTGKRVDVVHLPMRAGEDPKALKVGDPTTLAPLGLGPLDFLPLAQGIVPTVAWYAGLLR